MFLLRSKKRFRRDYRKWFLLVKRNFTRDYLLSGGVEAEQSVSREKDGRRGIWEKRFWEHTIRDEADYVNHVKYIHFNPVKREYVKAAEEWPYLTYRKFRW